MKLNDPTGFGKSVFFLFTVLPLPSFRPLVPLMMEVSSFVAHWGGFQGHCAVSSQLHSTYNAPLSQRISFDLLWLGFQVSLCRRLVFWSRR